MKRFLLVFGLINLLYQGFQIATPRLVEAGKWDYVSKQKHKSCFNGQCTTTTHEYKSKESGGWRGSSGGCGGGYYSRPQSYSGNEQVIEIDAAAAMFGLVRGVICLGGLICGGEKKVQSVRATYGDESSTNSGFTNKELDELEKELQKEQGQGSNAP